MKVVKKLYNATPMTVLEVIHVHGGGADPLLIVGHNPGLETTVSNIVGNIVPFPVGRLPRPPLRQVRSRGCWPSATRRDPSEMRARRLSLASREDGLVSAVFVTLAPCPVFAQCRSHLRPPATPSEGDRS